MEKEKRKIRVNLMGNIRFETPDGKTIGLSNDEGIGSIGKKQTAFLTYLFLNADQQLTTSKLIDTFWDDDSKDPYNSFRNTLYKVRQHLKNCFPECDEILILQHGVLKWSDNFEFSLDVDRFHDAYTKARGIIESNNIHWALEAYELYQGDVLPNASYEWLDSLNIYYRSIFIDLCKSLERFFSGNKQWDETLRLCQRAYALAPENEDFTMSMMYALINIGQPEAAAHHYESHKNFLWKRYRIAPSNELKSLYVLASDHSKSENYERTVIRQFIEPVKDRHAFECTPPIFRNLVQLELRNMIRSNQTSTILALTIEEQTDKLESMEDVQRLRRTILLGLRVADPFTKLTSKSFMILLPGATEEQAYMIAERLRDSYASTYSKATTIITAQAYPLPYSPI